MNAGEIWWGQIGNSLRLLTTVTNNLREGRSAVLQVPRNLPWRQDFYEAAGMRCAMLSAERRLALWLISEESNTVTLPASLSAFSDMLDIGRASLYRALDKLEGEGLIRREGRKITVISQDEILKKYQ